MNIVKELVQKYKTYKLIDKLQKCNNIDEVFDLLVPSEGQADTILGEIVRAVCRIGYRWNNDGDVYFLGYGKETAGGSATYLKQCAIKGIRVLFTVCQAENKREYDEFIETMSNEVMNVIKDKKQLKELLKENTQDSREDFDYDTRFDWDIEDYSHLYFIYNEDNDKVLMEDGTWEDWKEACEDTQYMFTSESEREARNRLNELKEDDPEAYKTSDIQDGWFAELMGDGSAIFDTENEAVEACENAILKYQFN